MEKRPLEESSLNKSLDEFRNKPQNPLNNKKPRRITKLKSPSKIFILILLIISGFLIYNFYFDDSHKNTQNIPNKAGETNSQKSSDVNSQNNPPAVKTPDKCLTIEDNYQQPDFERLKNILLENEIFQKIPSKGKISMKFYHFVEDCRKWDKSYYFSEGQINEGSINSDIEITMSSDYVDQFNENNFCEIIYKARNNRNLGEKINIGKFKLLWDYSGLIGYRNCFLKGELNSYDSPVTLKGLIEGFKNFVTNIFSNLQSLL